MSKGIGRLIQFGIAKETVRGTPENAATFWVPFNDLSIDEKFNLVKDEQSRGIIEDSVDAKIVKKWAEGSIKAPIGDKHFPLMLFSLFGSLSTSGPTDSSYTHTINVGQSAQHQALSLFIDDPLGGQDYKHGLGVLTSLELAYEQGKYIEYTANLKSKKGATATLTPASTSENRFLPQHLVFKLASTQSGLTGASAQIIKSLTLKVDQGIEDDDVLGSTDPADFLNKQFSIEGTVEALWQNESDFKTFVQSGTQKAMRIDLINTDTIIGSATNPSLRIDLYKVIFEPINRPFAVNDLVKQTLAFKAYYSTADSKMAVLTAVNAQTSY